MNVTVAHFMLLERPLWGNQGAGFGFTAYPTNVVRRLWTTDDASSLLPPPPQIFHLIPRRAR